MRKKYYDVFGDFLFRTPLLSYQLKNDIYELMKCGFFNEALYLASPVLVEETKKVKIIFLYKRLYISISVVVFQDVHYSVFLQVVLLGNLEKVQVSYLGH